MELDTAIRRGRTDPRAAPIARQVAAYRYREIQAIRGVTYTDVNRHITEGRRELRRAA